MPPTRTGAARSLAALVTLGVVVAVLGPPSAVGLASAQATAVDGCTVIDTPGTYRLTDDVNGSIVDVNDDNTYSCIEIAASDVVFDGGGHTVEKAVGRAVYSGGQDNVTVRDIVVNGSGALAYDRPLIGIELVGSNATLENATVSMPADDDDSSYAVQVLGTHARLSDLHATGGGSYVARLGGRDVSLTDSVVAGTDVNGVRVVGQSVNVRISDTRIAAVSPDGSPNPAVWVEGGDKVEPTERLYVEGVDTSGDIYVAGESRAIAIDDTTAGRLTLGYDRNATVRSSEFSGIEFYGDTRDIRVLDTAVGTGGITARGNGRNIRFHRIEYTNALDTRTLFQTYSPITATRLHVYGGTTVSAHGGSGIELSPFGGDPTMPPPDGYAGIGANVSVDDVPEALTLSFNYTDEQVAAAGVDESSLAIWKEGGPGEWTRVDGSTVDTGNNVVSANISNVTDTIPFAVFGRPAEGDGGTELNASFTMDPSPPVAGETLSLDASDSGGSIASYHWDYDADGDVDATGQQVTRVYEDPGDEKIRLVVTDGDGNTDAVTKYFSVVESSTDETELNASFAMDPSPPVEGESLSLDASGSSGSIASYHWDYDADGDVDATGEQVSRMYEDPGDEKIRLVVTDGDGNTDAVTRYFTVVESSDGGTELNASFAMDPSPPVAGESLSLDASDSSGSIASYHWDYDADGDVDATGKQVTRMYEDPGDEKIRLVVTDGNGNTDAVTKYFTVTS